jgi:hypothetical protein
MRFVTAWVILMLGAVKVSFAGEDDRPSNVFTDDWGPIPDLSFGLSGISNINPDGDLGSWNTGDLSSDLSLASADSSDFQTDEVSGLWDEGTTLLSVDGDDSNCYSGDVQLPARLRARVDECPTATTPSTTVEDPPVIFDLLDPKLKLKPICPLEQFPFYVIPVCSSGNPLDVWGPSTAVLLYDATEGRRILFLQLYDRWRYGRVLNVRSSESCRFGSLHQPKETLLLPQIHSRQRPISPTVRRIKARKTGTFICKKETPFHLI